MNDQYRHSVFFDYGVTEQPNANQEKVADKERDQKEAHNRSFTSNTPALHLHVIEPIRRNNTQARLLQEARLGQAQQPGSLVLDPSLDYAYWKCHLGPLLPNAVLNDKPFGYQPEQPMEWVSTNGAHVDAAARPVPNEVNLILFNVLVALEWTPDEAYMYQLEWAFRRASDYLYDVTDGRMAFGQVIFGGKDCMDCCDFQIMASNRFHPRSWVSGMHDPRKYLPVRLGRGNWHPGKPRQHPMG